MAANAQGSALSDDTTRIRFSGSKREGSAAQQRFQKYQEARTVGEAKKLGALAADLRWDLAQGLLQLVKGSSSTAKLAKAKVKGRADAAKLSARLVARRAAEKKRAPKPTTTKGGKQEKASKSTSAGLKKSKSKPAPAGSSNAKAKAEVGAPWPATPATPAPGDGGQVFPEGFKPKGTCYRPETYMVVTRWQESTRIAYQPHAKRPGTKSFVRYEAYSKAKTVGESLKKGSYPEDWCWDYERGFIKVLGGERDEPLDVSTVTDKTQLTPVDVVVGKWFKREAARMLGVSLEELSKDKSWCESIIMRIKRWVADSKAKAILDDCDAEKRPVTEEEVLQILQQWGFRANTSRENVMPDGVTTISSDTIGLIPSRDGRIIASREALDYPNVVRIFSRWLQANLPAEMRQPFPFTSINVNKNYAARLHRDGNNVGPSMIKAFGQFKGGLLSYWPDDDRKLPLEVLQSKPSLSLDLDKGLALFDGRRGHAVSDFEGERFSLVYFCCPRYWKASAALQKQLLERGVAFPTKTTAASALKMLAPPAGYSGGSSSSGGGRAPATKGEGKYRYWPIKSAEAIQARASRGTKRPASGDLKAIATPARAASKSAKH